MCSINTLLPLILYFLAIGDISNNCWKREDGNLASVQI